MRKGYENHLQGENNNICWDNANKLTIKNFSLI